MREQQRRDAPMPSTKARRMFFLAILCAVAGLLGGTLFVVAVLQGSLPRPMLWLLLGPLCATIGFSLAGVTHLRAGR